MTHPGVRRAAVVGVPHEGHGEEVKAFVIRRPGARVTGDELIWWSKRKLPSDRYPRLVEFRDTLPN
jgi:long-chain acyl-CoA synthetase